LRGLVILALGLALYALWYSNLHWTACSVASLLLFTACVYRRPAGDIRRLFCEAGRWRVELASGDSVEVHPRRDSVILPFLVVLRVALPDAGRVSTLMLGADAYPAETWRSLQLNLRQDSPAGPG
jgi:hypothetical protein